MFTLRQILPDIISVIKNGRNQKSKVCRAHKNLRVGSPKKIGHFEKSRLRWEVNIKMGLTKSINGMVWTGVMWLRIVICGKMLRTKY
jgi:hypothetical protein